VSIPGHARRPLDDRRIKQPDAHTSPFSPVESETEELLVTANLADATTTIVATAVPFVLAVRALAGRSVTIGRPDASATSLYPVVREEADPPRWRLELMRSRTVEGEVGPQG
jgi:hypothetical protein